MATGVTAVGGGEPSAGDRDLCNYRVSAIVEQMPASDLVSTGDAARQLGVHPSRVRALLAAGELRGFKLGDRWMVQADSIRRRGAAPSAPGRPLRSANAWAALSLASGEGAAGLTPDARWRLRGLLDQQGVSGLSPRLRHRARRERYRAHPGVLDELSKRSGLVHTGIGAAGAHGLDLATGNELDAYVSLERRDAVVDAFALESVEAGGNVSLRVLPAGVEPFAESRVVAPLAAVALDLSEEAESRSARVGREALATLDEQRQWRARSGRSAHGQSRG